MARPARDLIGVTILASRDWIVTDVAADGIATLAFYSRADRTLIAGDFVGPDPIATRLVDVIRVPVNLLWDAIECGLVEMESGVTATEPDSAPRLDHAERPSTFGAIICADWSGGG